MKRQHKQYIKAKQKGMSNVDILKMKEIAKREAIKMETEATDRAFLYMLAIPLNVLVNDYWSKTAKKRAKKFIEDVISLYDSVCEGVVSEKELSNLLEEMAGVKITADWLKGDNNGGC